MRRVRLGDVLRLVREPVLVNPVEEYTSIGVRGFGRGIFHYESKAGNELGRLRFFRVRPGELVVSNIKAWEGAIAISSTTDAGTIASNRFLTYTSDPGEVDLSFLRYLLLSEVGMPLIQKASPGSADRNRTLAIERFETLEVPLPDIHEQRRIASHLDRISYQARSIDLKLDHVSKLVDGLIRKSLQAITPVRSGRASDVLSLERLPVEVRPDERYTTVGVRSFGKGLFHYPSRPGAEIGRLRFFELLPNRLVISNIKAWEGAVGRSTARDEGCIASNRFLVMEPSEDDLDLEFAVELLLSPLGLPLLDKASPGSADRNRTLSVERFMALKLPLPPLNVQQSVVATTRRLRRRQELANRQRIVASALLPSALNRAFAGMT